MYKCKHNLFKRIFSGCVPAVENPYFNRLDIIYGEWLFKKNYYVSIYVAKSSYFMLNKLLSSE